MEKAVFALIGVIIGAVIAAVVTVSHHTCNPGCKSAQSSTRLSDIPYGYAGGGDEVWLSHDGGYKSPSGDSDEASEYVLRPSAK